MSTTPAPSAPSSPLESPIRIGIATAAVFGGVFVGLGLARFAFAPLQPALVAHGWFSASTSALLAAANLAGYLIGALAGAHLARRFSVTSLLRVLMLIVALSFFACMDRSLPFVWFFLWRVASGVGGGAIMALAGPAVLAHVEASRRALIGQISLFGVSLGIIVAGALMPVLLTDGIPLVWLVLGSLALVATAITWRMWPPSPRREAAVVRPPPGQRLFYLQYGLVAMGVVPQMIFLVDYIARDLGRGVSVGSSFYLVYGAGAVVGPLMLGFVAGRIGLRPTIRMALVIQFIAVGLLMVATGSVVLALSCFLAGLGMPGLLAGFLLRSQQIADGDLLIHRALWGKATASFATGQALAAFGTVYLIDTYGEHGAAYPVLFVVSTAAMAIAIALDFAIRK